MTVNNNKVQRIIENLKVNISNLNELKLLSLEDFTSDFKNNSSALRLLQISIESIIDLGNHIISRKNLKAPDTYGDIFKILCNNNVVSELCKDKCISMVKFRNRIVHTYWDIDLEMVYNYIKADLSDFDLFIEKISKGL